MRTLCRKDDTHSESAASVSSNSARTSSICRICALHAASSASETHDTGNRRSTASVWTAYTSIQVSRSMPAFFFASRTMREISEPNVQGSRLASASGPCCQLSATAYP